MEETKDLGETIKKDNPKPKYTSEEGGNADLGGNKNYEGYIGNLTTISSSLSRTRFTISSWKRELFQTKVKEHGAGRGFFQGPCLFSY